MKVVLNGREIDTAAATLDAFMVEAGYEGAVVATALNGQFVARTMRDGKALCEGDKIEIVAPMQGG